MVSLVVWFIPLILFGSWLVSKKAKASTSTDEYNQSQLKIINKIRAEATKQGVPVEFALATADLESGFENKQNVSGGQSFGPMQVNVVNLKSGETVDQLKNLDFNIKRGVEILKKYLKQAGGNTYKARILYFCGPGLCKGNPPERLTVRWNEAASKWAVPVFYSGFNT